MFKKPQLKRCFRFEQINQESFLLLSERETAFLANPLFQKVIPFLNGKLTQEEIATQLHGDLPEAYVFYALMELEQQGWITEGEGAWDLNFSLLCESLSIDIHEADRRLQSTQVSLRALEPLSSQDWSDSLGQLQIHTSHEGDIEIVLTDDYLREELAAINRVNLDKSRPWMLVKPVGTVLWLGPIFHPQKTGCWDCLAQRLRNNRPSEGFIQRQRDNLSPLTSPLVDLPVTQQLSLSMATNEILKWVLKGENKQLEGVLVTYDTLSLRVQNHILVKRPQCPQCGYLKSHQHYSPVPVILGSGKKQFTKDGGHRSVSPEEILKRYQHHINPLLGVVRSLEKLPNDCNGLAHIYATKHHWVSMFDDVANLKKNVGGRSGGKGRTNAQGRASGFCEAIERYSGIFQGDEIRIESSYQKLGDHAIHPNACMNFSQAQYQNREGWNAQYTDEFQRVPEPFNESREIEWTPIWSLTQKDFKYLPTAYCYFGYPKPDNPDCWADTNGCAAGNTLEEAILHGFLELVERDSVALWWYNCLQKPKVDLTSFDEPYFQAVTDYYQSIGRELWVVDLTGDLKIPTFAAISRRRDRPVEDLIFGFGTHFNPALAIQRALTEICQVLQGVLLANPDGTTRYTLSAEPHMIQWWQTATLENQPCLVPDDSIAAKCGSDYEVIWHEDFLKDIQYCQKLVESKGMEILVLDQTRPDIRLKVVKVIVPGLRHFWKRLGPGRLYDVPVQMGWLEKSLLEEELNPIPLWM